MNTMEVKLFTWDGELVERVKVNGVEVNGEAFPVPEPDVIFHNNKYYLQGEVHSGDYAIDEYFEVSGASI
jgi:hypothetical protein